MCVCVCVCDRFASQISFCERKWYFSANLSVVFRSRAILITGRKDVLSPVPNIAALWFILLDVCSLQYIRRTNQRLDSRIKQKVPTKIQQGNYLADLINNTYGSSFEEHLINNRNCASSYNADLFTIVSKSHSDFRLKDLETIHIFTHKHSLCLQRECLLGLNLITIRLTLSFLNTKHSLFFPLLQSPCPMSFLNRLSSIQL